MKASALLATLLAAAALAGCGGDDSPADAGGDTVPAAATGPGISIEEALESTSDDPVLVNGSLLVEGGQARLCSALAESFPPQCGGASLRVTGLTLAGLDGITAERDVMWSNEPIKLFGVVSDGVLTVRDNAS